MKSLKVWVAIGVIVVVGAIGIHGFFSHNEVKQQKVNDASLTALVLNNSQNDNQNNLPITTPMKITTQRINLNNGIYIPKGTYEAPIELADGNMHTDYLITGMVTSKEPIPVYNTILDGSGSFKEYPAGTNLLVIGYVDGYFILGSAAGDVDGFGYKTDTMVSAKNMTLIPNESNLYALTLGNAPYKVDLEYNSNEGAYNLYQYPTDLSKVVGKIAPQSIGYNTQDNEATIINTANKMVDIEYKGQKGWMLSSDLGQIPTVFVGKQSAASTNNGS